MFNNKRYNTPSDSILLYPDEKGSQLQEHGGSSWSSVHAKVEKAQKINRLLNVFEVYDNINDKMHIHCYRKKTEKQFVDFLKRVIKGVTRIFKISLLYLITFQHTNQM